MSRKNKVSPGYSLSDLSLGILGFVFVFGLFSWISKGFILTYISGLILVVVLHQLMKHRQISYLYKLPIFLFVIMGLVQRVFFLIADPDGYAFDFTRSLTDKVLAGTLSYAAYILFILWCFLGLHGYFKKGKAPLLQVLEPAKSTKLLMVSTGYYFISIFITAYLGIFHNVAMQGGESSPLGYLTRIFDIEQAPLIVIFLYAYCRDILSKRQRNLVVLLIICSVMYTVFRGSRSAILIVVFVSWFAVVAINPIFLIQKKHLVMACVILVGIGFPLFFIALSFRGLHLNQQSFDLASMIQELSFFDMFNQVSARLGELDTFSAVLFQLQLHDYTEYATLTGTLDGTIKGLLPSFLYTQTTYSIDQVFPYIFRGIPLDSPHGEHWTGPGMFIAYFGVYLAPFCMALFMFFCINMGDNISKYFKNSQIGYIMRANFSYSFFFPIISTGAFSFMLPGVIRFAIILWILGITSRLFIPSLKRKSVNGYNGLLFK